MLTFSRRVHLIRHLDNGTQDFPIQMLICMSHTANVSKYLEIMMFRTNQRISLKMRNYSPCQIRDRPRLILVCSIRSRIPNSSAPEVRMQPLQQLQISLIERNGKRWPGFYADSQFFSKTERDRETTFALHKARNEPRVQQRTTVCLHKNCSSFPLAKKGRVTGVLRDRLYIDIAPHLSDQSLRGQYHCICRGTTSLGIARRQFWRVGFPRYEPVFRRTLAGARGNWLPDKEFRYLRTVIFTAAVYQGFDHKLRAQAH